MLKYMDLNTIEVFISGDRLTPSCCHTWDLNVSHHVIRHGKQTPGSCESRKNSKYTPPSRQHTKPREKMHSTVTPLVEWILVLGKGNGASLLYLDLIISDLCAWKVERIHSSSGGARDQEIIDIFDWVVDVIWCIWILDLINHSNVHTTQERPVLIMLIRRMDWCCFYYFLRNSLVALLEALFARNAVEVWHISDFPSQPLDHIYWFVCLFVVTKPEKPYFASCVGRKVNPHGVITGFWVFGLLCSRTAGDSITSETHTSGAQ